MFPQRVSHGIACEFRNPMLMSYHRVNPRKGYMAGAGTCEASARSKAFQVGEVSGEKAEFAKS